jgi:hypothetical protein
MPVKSFQFCHESKFIASASLLSGVDLTTNSRCLVDPAGRILSVEKSDKLTAVTLEKDGCRFSQFRIPKIGQGQNCRADLPRTHPDIPFRTDVWMRDR